MTTAIETVEDLQAFAREHRLRPDWHEPDERDVNARIIGTHLDNAYGSTDQPSVASDGFDFTEFNGILTVEGKDAAVVNLATLLALAAR